MVASMLADEDFYDRLVARIPLGRIAEPDDLVGAVLFFCSDASAFVDRARCSRSTAASPPRSRPRCCRAAGA